MLVKPMFQIVDPGKLKLSLLMVVVVSCACSTFQPPDVNGPRANARPYPVAVTNDETKSAGLLAWKNLLAVRGTAAPVEPQFSPLTGTIAALPPNNTSEVSLPKVGTGTTPTEEEIRESLRRFINEWHEVIGAEPQHLSLIERTDEPSGLKLARYEQRPFRLALRGGFGNLLIRFRDDRRVVELMSNCIPNSEHLQPALAAVSPKVSAEEASAHVLGRTITLTDANGLSRSFTIPSGTALEVQQLVVYALASADKQALELHLAWEIAVPNGSIKSIYLDAITDEVIATN